MEEAERQKMMCVVKLQVVPIFYITFVKPTAVDLTTSHSSSAVPQISNYQMKMY